MTLAAHTSRVAALALFLALFLAPLSTLASTAATPTATKPAGDDPWALLDAARHQAVEAGPTVADFTQDFLPAGFSSGDRETGRLSLALPSCLRWDYELPYAKSFLLCGEVLYFWNVGESDGRRVEVNARNEPGLDLLLAAVEDLARRYRANSRRLDDGTVEIDLEPLAPPPADATGAAAPAGPAVGSIARATLRLAPDGPATGERKSPPTRIIGLTWNDVEGNRTRFEFSSYRHLPAGASRATLFTPPIDVHFPKE